MKNSPMLSISMTLGAGFALSACGIDKIPGAYTKNNLYKGAGGRTKRQIKGKSFGKSEVSRLMPNFGNDKSVGELNNIKSRRRNIAYHAYGCSCFACYRKRKN